MPQGAQGGQGATGGSGQGAGGGQGAGNQGAGGVGAGGQGAQPGQGAYGGAIQQNNAPTGQVANPGGIFTAPQGINAVLNPTSATPDIFGLGNPTQPIKGGVVSTSPKTAALSTALSIKEQNKPENWASKSYYTKTLSMDIKTNQYSRESILEKEEKDKLKPGNVYTKPTSKYFTERVGMKFRKWQ